MSGEVRTEGGCGWYKATYSLMLLELLAFSISVLMCSEASRTVVIAVVVVVVIKDIR